MNEETITNANYDESARRALWRAICLAVEDIEARFDIREILADHNTTPFLNSNIPNVFTWQLVEALSLLCVIRQSNYASGHAIRLFGKTGPVKIFEDGIERFLWAQNDVGEAISGLSGRPDLTVTSSNDKPSKHNLVRIIEVKCVNRLGAQLIRSEFGKAYDLRVTNFLIWSYYTPTQNIIDGANQLGIDIEPIGFDTSDRDVLIRSPDALIAKMAFVQDRVRREQRFGRLIADAGEEVERKLLT